MKLKNIPANTIVHTPTEEEARELLAILHENGYRWKGSGSMTDTHGAGTIYNLKINERTDERDYEQCVCLTTDSGITLPEFKERYCEDEKPQPKFKVGDKVIDLQSGAIRIIQDKDYKNGQWSYLFNDEVIEWVIESALEPYTEPETKPTEDMKINNELNLCELLRGHEGESIFLTTMGEVLVEKVSEEHLFFRLKATEPGWRLNANGKMNENGVVITYPSRELYEQYPLDPLKAWSVWQEEQEYEIRIATGQKKNDYFDIVSRVSFRTPADRDKCIEVIDAFLKQIQQSKSVASLCEEIKAIIEKYSK